MGVSAKTASELYGEKLKNLGLSYCDFLSMAKRMELTGGASKFFELFFIQNSTIADAAKMHDVSYTRARQVACGIFMKFEIHLFRERNKKGA